MHTSQLERFLVSIRRTDRQRIMSNVRKAFHYGCPPIYQICQSLGLSQPNYNLQEILQQKQQYLLHIEELKTQNNDATIKAHLNFWSYAAEQLYTKEYRPSGLFKDFLFKFIKLNSYRSLHFDQLYEKKVIYVLQLAAQTYLQKQQKQILLQWVEGTEGLSLLTICIEKQYLDPKEYSNVYRLMIAALKMVNVSKETLKKNTIQVLSIVKNMCEQACIDQIHNIAHHYPQLMISIASTAMKNLDDRQLIVMSSQAICALMNTYTQTVYSYGIDGIAYLAGTLIMSEEESIVSCGLQILQILSQLDKFQMVQFLLTNYQLNELELWSKFKVYGQLLTHKQIQIKRKTVWIIANIYSNGSFQQICAFTQMLSLSEANIIDQLKDILMVESDETIMRNSLSILSMMLFYGDQHLSEGTNMIRVAVLEKGFPLCLRGLLEHSCEEVRSGCENILMGLDEQF